MLGLKAGTCNCVCTGECEPCYEMPEAVTTFDADDWIGIVLADAGASGSISFNGDHIEVTQTSPDYSVGAWPGLHGCRFLLIYKGWSFNNCSMERFSVRVEDALVARRANVDSIGQIYPAIMHVTDQVIVSHDAVLLRPWYQERLLRGADALVAASPWGNKTDAVTGASLPQWEFPTVATDYSPGLLVDLRNSSINVAGGGTIRTWQLYSFRAKAGSTTCERYAFPHPGYQASAAALSVPDLAPAAYGVECPQPGTPPGGLPPYYPECGTVGYSGNTAASVAGGYDPAGVFLVEVPPWNDPEENPYGLTGLGSGCDFAWRLVDQAGYAWHSDVGRWVLTIRGHRYFDESTDVSGIGGRTLTRKAYQWAAPQVPLPDGTFDALLRCTGFPDILSLSFT